MAAMSRRMPAASPRVRAVGRIVVGVVVVVALVRIVGGAPFLRGLAAVTPLTIVVSALLAAVATTAAAWRWRTLSHRLGAPLSWPEAVGAYYRSQFLNSVLPGGVVGDVDRAVAHGRRTGRPAAAARGVAAERVAGQLVQLVAAAGVVVALGVRLDIPLWGLLGLAALGATIAVALSLSVRARGAVVRELGLVGAAFRDPAVLAKTVVASIVVLGAHTATFVVACLAVGADADPAVLGAVAVTTVLVGSLPLSVGGWGTREAVAAWAFGAAGLGASAGVTASTAFGVLATIAVLPGLVVLGASSLGRQRAVRRGSATRPTPLSPPSLSHREPA